MSRKQIRSQEPIDGRNSMAKKNRARKAAGRLRKESEARTATSRSPALGISRPGVSTRSRVFIVVALAIPLIAIAAIRAQQGKAIGTQQNYPERVSTVLPAAQTTASGPKSGEVSPTDLTSAALYSKEYIYGPGGRIIATQDRVIFTDLNGVDFVDDIYRIAARGVTLGCSTTTYCPNDIVLRDQMAVFIERALGVFSPPTPTMQHFTDVAPGYWAYAFIEDFAARHITDGCTSTTYCPTGTVTHDQMAKFIIRARGEPDPPWPTQQRFNDVPISGPNQKGQGCPGNNNYCPATPVKRNQMAHILVKAFGI